MGTCRQSEQHYSWVSTGASASGRRLTLQNDLNSSYRAGLVGDDQGVRLRNAPHKSISRVASAPMNAALATNSNSRVIFDLLPPLYRQQSRVRHPCAFLAQGWQARTATDENATKFSSWLSPLWHAFGMRLLQRRTPRPTWCWARPRRRSCRASSTTCTAHSADNPLASPPRFPDGRAE